MAEEYNASNKEMIEEQKRRREIIRAQQIQDVQRIASTPEGVRFFQRMLIDSNYFAQVKVADPDIHYYQGARNFVSAYVVDLITSAPGALINILHANPGGNNV